MGWEGRSGRGVSSKELTVGKCNEGWGETQGFSWMEEAIRLADSKIDKETDSKEDYRRRLLLGEQGGDREEDRSWGEERMKVEES